MGTHRRLDHAQVLEAAQQLVREEGFQALTFQHLAKRLGIRSQSLYNYYDNVDAMIEDLGATFMADLYTQLLEAATGLSGRSALAAYTATAHQFFDQNGALVQLFYYVHRYPQDSPFVAATAKVLDLLRRLITHTKLRHMSPQAFEQALIASVLGFSVLEIMGFMPHGQNGNYAQLVNLYLNEVIA
ncbi:TetR/AcrR family transcriptional regulator [Lacticaseibacillus kribbianus]|uniref:TetR/AcrR family transcriptional regulator n=1 Tax=Lacticaseibacillus kribbianus TaxID=2926292 RepID=UPI001CD33488|nr:TetR/AcrR family transcriptional regulator [Lacticaseibacillus kribbianus]